MNERARTAGRSIRLNLMTVMAGLLGALVANATGLPLPWLLGPLVGTALYASMGQPILISPPFRHAMLAVLGVLLGSSFTTDFLAQAQESAIALSFLIPYTLIATIIVFSILNRTTSLDMTTAFFSAVPGGVNEMTLMGTERGGDEAALAVHHSLRLILVIVIISLVFAFAYGYSRGGGPRPTGHPLTPADYAWIVGIAFAGVGFARLVRLPAVYILGPMVVSAVVHVAGFTDVKPSYGLVAFAQLVSGAAIGAQFARFTRKDFLVAGATAVKIAAILILFTLGFAWLVSYAVDRPFPILLLAYAPGGMGEMGLIALSLGADAAFVSTGQVVRFFIVVTMAVPFYKVMSAWRDRAI